MVFTDPPYNVPIDGHVCGSGSVKHREFAMAAGEMSEQEFTEFLQTVFGHLVRHSADGAIHFVCMDWRHMGEILAAGQATFTELKNLMVWVKDNGGMGSFYRSRHELVFAFKSGTAPHINSFELGQHGRYRTNVWEYRGVNTLKSGRMAELELHPTVKPVEMIADAIKDCSKRGGIILDPFGGSGSTLIAAAKTGRRARLAELDPVYVDRIIRRWQGWAKDDAVHADTGEAFEAVAAERARLPPIPMTRWREVGPDDAGQRSDVRKRRRRPTRLATASLPRPPGSSPAQSGNPGGRPKGSGKAKTTDVVVEQMKALVLEEAYRPIQIRDGDQLVELPVMQAVVRSLALNAAKGQQRAQRMLIDLIAAVEGERRKNREKLFEAVVEYKQHWEKEIALARRTACRSRPPSRIPTV